MTSQNQQYDTGEGQEAHPGEILGALPTSRNDYWTLQARLQLLEYAIFVFLTISYKLRCFTSIVMLNSMPLPLRGWPQNPMRSGTLKFPTGLHHIFSGRSAA